MEPGVGAVMDEVLCVCESVWTCVAMMINNDDYSRNKASWLNALNMYIAWISFDDAFSGSDCAEMKMLVSRLQIVQ
jgi:hypothetical protein